MWRCVCLTREANDGRREGCVLSWNEKGAGKWNDQWKKNKGMIEFEFEFEFEF